MPIRKIIYILCLVATIAVLAIIAVAFFQGRTVAGQVSDLDSTLADRNVELVVAFCPYGSYRNYGFLSRMKNYVMLAIRPVIISGFKSHSIPTLDFKNQFDIVRRNKSNFEDSIHMTSEGMAEFSNLVIESFPEWKDYGNVLIIGECYAVQLSHGINQLSNISIPPTTGLRAYDDSIRVVELMFLFEDTHLADINTVIWLVPDRRSLWNRLSGYNTKPTKPDNSITVTKSVTAITDIGYDWRNWEEAQAKMTYPNALGEIIVADQDNPEDKMVLVSYSAKNRIKTGFESIKAGNKLDCIIKPLNNHLIENPDIASEAYLTTVDAPDIPRFWVVDWTKIDTEGDWKLSPQRADESASDQNP